MPNRFSRISHVECKHKLMLAVVQHLAATMPLNFAGGRARELARPDEREGVDGDFKFLADFLTDTRNKFAQSRGGSGIGGAGFRGADQFAIGLDQQSELLGAVVTARVFARSKGIRNDQNSGTDDGKPTRMKDRAKACEKCSRNGEHKRQRSPS